MQCVAYEKYKREQYKKLFIDKKNPLPGKEYINFMRWRKYSEVIK